MSRYDRDVLASTPKQPAHPVIDAEPDLVVEDREGGFCGAVVAFEAGAVVLEDRHGARRLFPLRGTVFLLDGRPVTLRRPPRPVDGPTRTASGSTSAPLARARVARGSRIWVEGRHDAELVERVWGDDLRIEGVVVEELSGVDNLAQAVRAFGPGPDRRLGVLVDHLVEGSKESRVTQAVQGQFVLVTGHPYVDIWQAVRPAVVGIAAWPVVPPGQPWKEGVCAVLGVAEPAQLWRRILASVSSFRDLEAPLVGAVERLIDHVTEAPDPV